MNDIKPDLTDMVERFLSWRLPDDFSPDCGIGFKPINHQSNPWPIGTNLFTAQQAEAMILNVLGDVVTYAKDNESISDCIARNRNDISKLIGMLAKEKQNSESLEKELEHAKSRINSLTTTMVNDG